jgi:hypothetical protein
MKTDPTQDDDRSPADFAKAVESLRQDMLCSAAGDGLGPFSEQHFLLALAALETAQRHLSLCYSFYAQECYNSEKRGW